MILKNCLPFEINLRRIFLNFFKTSFEYSARKVNSVLQ